VAYQNEDEAQAAVKTRRPRERAAFGALVEQYQQPLGSYLMHLVGDLDTALPLTRQTFVGAYQEGASKRPGIAVRPWLYRAATRLALGHLRRKPSARKPLSQPELVTSVPSAGKPEERELIQAVLRDLEPDERAVLLLCEFERLPHDEVATILGSGTERVRQRLAKARTRFRLAYIAHDALAGGVFDRPSPPGAL
jgi:RNA polymerase sigma factor (sigma-70 family)